VVVLSVQLGKTLAVWFAEFLGKVGCITTAVRRGALRASMSLSFPSTGILRQRHRRLDLALILFADGLNVPFAVRVEEFFAALLPGRS
jgi:hypothetical protein